MSARQTTESHATTPAPPDGVRSFASGMEVELAALWNRAHAPYGGHVPRSAEYWRWCILERPGVEPDDVLILTDAGTADAPRVTAYGVLGPGGMVLECAIDPELLGQKREAIAQQLVTALEERCRRRGDESIAFELPRTDGPVGRVMEASGYRIEDTGSLQVVIVDLAALLGPLLTLREARLPHGWSPSFDLRIEPGAYHFCPQRRLQVRIGPPIEVEVLEEADTGPEPAPAPTTASPDPAAADCTVSLDISILTDIIFGRSTFEEARAAGRIEVHPAAREQDVRTFMSLLVLKSPWYTPNADGR